MQLLRLKVRASEDDAFERSGSVDVAGAMKLVVDDWIGLRFQAVTVPLEAVVQAATLRIYLNSASHDDVQLYVYGEAADSHTGRAAFGVGDITNRTLTTARATVASNGVGVGWLDITVTGVVQEVISNAAWASGQALVLILPLLTGTDLWLDDYDSAPATAAELIISYVAGGRVSGYARLLVGDRYGRILTESEVQPGPVSWRLNNVGRVTLPFARSDPKAIEDYLAFGNRLLLQFDNGLPNWGGVIDLPRDWRRDAIVTTAYSAEQLFGLAQTDRGRYFNDATVGYIFERLITEANEAYGLGVQLGYIWPGGSGHGPHYHFDTLLEIIQRSLCGRLSGADFDVTTTEEGGYIVFRANLYERRGSDKPGVVLLEDINLADIRLLEQGTIINEWHMIGEGTGWGDDRPVKMARDAASIARYGLRQGSEIFPGTSELSTLQAAADARLEETKDPKNMWEAEAFNLAPARFADYDYGDSVRLLAPGYGFGGSDVMVRVQAREYDGRKNTCKLVVREDVSY